MAGSSKTQLVFVTDHRLASLGSLELDASVSEQHHSQVQVTEHPVEKGANVSDHARALPEVLTIEGFVSNTPINQADRPPGAEFPEGGDGKAQTAFKILRELKDAGTPITVVTALHTYESMIITELTFPRNAQVGDALRFTANLKQIRTVATRVSIVPKLPANVSKTKGGKKVGTPAPAPVMKAWDASLYDFFTSGGPSKFVAK